MSNRRLKHGYEQGVMSLPPPGAEAPVPGKRTLVQMQRVMALPPSSTQPGIPGKRTLVEEEDGHGAWLGGVYDLPPDVRARRMARGTEAPPSDNRADDPTDQQPARSEAEELDALDTTAVDTAVIDERS